MTLDEEEQINGQVNEVGLLLKEYTEDELKKAIKENSKVNRSTIIKYIQDDT